MPTLLEQATTDMHKLENLEVKLCLDGFEALVMLGQLQLALRHPGQSERLIAITTEIARHIQIHLAVTPALANIMERGWDPEYDVPTT